MTEFLFKKVGVGAGMMEPLQMQRQEIDVVLKDPTGKQKRLYKDTREKLQKRIYNRSQNRSAIAKKIKVRSDDLAS
jgi:Cu/Ag efflux pump CusA